MTAVIDLTGKEFGYLSVKQRGENNKSKQACWVCICKCGNTLTVEGDRLRSGKTKSCGCFRIETIQTRGENLAGKKFGRLTVIEKAKEKNKSGVYPWICKCECGNIKNIRSSNLKEGTTQSCGCLNDEKRRERKSNFEDLTGKVFGKLTVKNEAPRNGKKYIQWICKCECGEETVVSGSQLRDGRTKSCGCLRNVQHRLGENREEAILRKLYAGVIHRRKHRGDLINDITYDEFKSIIFKPCVYCGTENSNYSKDVTDGRLITDTIIRFNGIDRLNSKIGYTIGNCVPCCKNCNIAKGEMSPEDFLLWIKRTYEHYIGGVKKSGEV
ncbi:hypothetical protein MZM54_01570 [[Brevibacterium] frigoritolerans]|nr:hypothetical protein [Peribacillus frigoritolerans]